MTSPIYYIDRIVIKRERSAYLEDIPYEYEYFFIEPYQNIRYGSKGRLFPGQLSDIRYQRNYRDCGRTLKIIAKTAHGNVESNTLVLPNARAHQHLSFKIITKGNRQIYLVEVPFQEEIIPLSCVTEVDEDGIIFNGDNGEQKKILFTEAYDGWKECMGFKDTEQKYIANCSEGHLYELRFFTKNRENISFWNGEDYFKRWKKLIKKIKRYGYDIFDSGKATVEGTAKHIKENILGRKIEPPPPQTTEEWIKELIKKDLASE